MTLMWLTSCQLQRSQRNKLLKRWASLGLTSGKGMVIRSRLCAIGFTKWIKNLSDKFASTPVIMILKLVLVFALSMQWRIYTYDITAALLRATLHPEADPIYLWPPEEYFPLKNII